MFSVPPIKIFLFLRKYLKSHYFWEESNLNDILRTMLRALNQRKDFWLLCSTSTIQKLSHTTGALICTHILALAHHEYQLSGNTCTEHWKQSGCSLLSCFLNNCRKNCLHTGSRLGYLFIIWNQLASIMQLMS